MVLLLVVALARRQPDGVVGAHPCRPVGELRGYSFGAPVLQPGDALRVSGSACRSGSCSRRCSGSGAA
ncbi:hypothetical protein C731_0634 [Mycolicibacterium hassiacum DSM 44199]|uniref:Uncharacterized protein n=1 Tax=Mycolicibacterium hassiacum (strain DSM 44199 / CIP 105218 / JCM 12690 / 3849) TaxID=1122247 RepID=K5BH63_MYCHD|nr:hypothetical protein C731_0634 [Mycolicibacterium hassiacum DSM 44199]